MSENIMYKNIADKMKAQQERIEYLERSNNRREDTILELRQEIAEQEDYKIRCEKAVEYIKKATRWFDSEYAKVYGELCSCAGANANRLEVLVNPSNLSNILNGRSDE